MAHRNMVGGTAYDTTGGRALVDGTVYSIQKGKTMVDGTVREIAFSSPVTVNIFDSKGSTGTNRYATITIDGTVYSNYGTFVLDRIGEITVKNNSSFGGGVYFNEMEVTNPYTFTPNGTIVNIDVPTTTIGANVYITTE